MKCPTLAVVLVAGCCAAASNPLAEGIALLEKGDAQRSLPLLRRAVEVDSGSAPAHNYLGFALGRTGSIDAAIEEFAGPLPSIPDMRKHSTISARL